MLEFPSFSFQTWRPRLDGVALTGGQSTSNTVQTVKTDGGGRWLFEMGDSNLNQVQSLKLWRAYEALLDGGATEVILKLCDRRQSTGWPYVIVDNVPHDDDTLFDDDTGYSQESTSPIYAGAAALRATSMSVNSDSLIAPGEHFSIEHPTAGWRLYRVGARDGAVITFRPPLREAIAAGTFLETEQPRCVVRQIDASSFAPAVTRHRYAKGSAAFMESFDYAN